MKTFEFFYDQKVTTWMRTDFEVKAKDLNEAVKIAKEMYERGDLDELNWEETFSILVSVFIISVLVSCIMEVFRPPFLFVQNRSGRRS
jgi:hypothetical protein